MKQLWFKRFGWFFIPTHPAGFLITLLAIIFMVPACLAIIRNGDSVADNLSEIFVYGTCTAFWWKWVAEKTCE